MTSAATCAVGEAVAVRDEEAALEFLLLDLPQPLRFLVQDQWKAALREACQRAGSPVPAWLREG